jgi:hypothetical protein
MGSSALVVVISVHGYFSLIAFYSALYCMPKRELFTLCMLVMYLDVVLCCTAEPLFSYAIMCVVCAFCDLFVQPCLCDGILVLLELGLEWVMLKVPRKGVISWSYGFYG